MAPVPTIKLSSGYEMPQVGFGLWKVDNPVAADAVYNAIKAGYRLFDGACDYGNEAECGQGVARAIKEGLVKREELFIVSKLWTTFHESKHVEPIARKQLADWGVDYFDLYLIHFPVALEYVDPAVRYPPGWQYEGDEIRRGKATIQETWTAMEGLVGKGLVRSIGISNFQAQLIYDLLRFAKIRPATLQIEHHPYLVQQELLNLAKHEGIAVTAYSSFGPASFKRFNMEQVAKMGSLLEDETIHKIAAKYNRPASQVLLRWATQRGLAIIPKTVRPPLMASNLASIEFDLAEEDIATISAFNRGIRFNKPSHYFPTELLWIFA